jgi:hypothetical protein
MTGPPSNGFYRLRSQANRKCVTATGITANNPNAALTAKGSGSRGTGTPKSQNGDEAQLTVTNTIVTIAAARKQ